MLEARNQYVTLQHAYRVGEKYLVPMPRVASSAMGLWCNERGFKSVKPDEIPRGAPFATFVRHPLQRVISAYCLRMSDNEPYWAGVSSFREFLAQLPGSTDIHVRQQSELIESVGKPSFIGRYEILGIDWERFCAWTGVEHSPLVHFRRSARPRETFLPPSLLRELVGDRYRRDAEELGYP